MENPAKTMRWVTGFLTASLCILMLFLADFNVTLIICHFPIKSGQNIFYGVVIVVFAFFVVLHQAH